MEEDNMIAQDFKPEDATHKTKRKTMFSPYYKVTDGGYFGAKVLYFWDNYTNKWVRSYCHELKWLKEL